MSESWRLWQERHLAAVRRAIAALNNHSALSSIGFEDAVDVFYALTDTDVYRALSREHGWSPDQYELWLLGFACRQLLT